MGYGRLANGKPILRPTLTLTPTLTLMGWLQDQDIEQNGGPHMRFLYPMQKIFCQTGGQSGCDILYPDHQNRWNAAIPQMRQYLSQQKILGFFVGDEMFCRGAGAETLTLIACEHPSP